MEGDTPSFHWPIRRIFRDRQEKLDDVVLLEEPLEILINGQSIAVLMRMPGREKELAAGFCISEGYVRRAGDIMIIHHCGSSIPTPGKEGTDEALESRNRIELRVREEGFSRPQSPDALRLIRSGCGAADVSGMSEDFTPLPEGFQIQPSIILGLGKSMRDLQDFHHHLGGTHSAALFDAGGRAVNLAEDIGRHNAVDKTIGHCLMRRIPLEDKILVTSGRASYEMATKAIRVGIPVIATISAPTSLAVHLAHEWGLTLIGYLRGGRMNVYTHEGRLTGDLPGNR
jgi:FdhD protein